MRKALYSLLTLILCFTFLVSPVGADSIKVYDYANLLTIEQIEALESSIATLSDTYQMDIGVVTTEDVQGKATWAYADDFYDTHDYGYGSDYSGILFLIDMDNRVPHISTCGTGIEYFTDSRIDQMLDAVYPYLASGDFYESTVTFLDQVELYLKAGIPYNQETIETTPPHEPFKNEYGQPLNAVSILLSIVSAFVMASLITLGMRFFITRRYSKPKYTQPSTRPDDLSVYYKKRDDRFVNTYTTRVKIQTNNPPSGGGSGGSGGSSVHTSSSGRSHGGGTGRGF